MRRIRQATQTGIYKGTAGPGWAVERDDYPKAMKATSLVLLCALLLAVLVSAILPRNQLQPTAQRAVITPGEQDYSDGEDDSVSDWQDPAEDIADGYYNGLSAKGASGKLYFRSKRANKKTERKPVDFGRGGAMPT